MKEFLIEMPVIRTALEPENFIFSSKLGDLQLIVAMLALKSIIGLIPTLCGLASIIIVAPLGTVLGMLAQRVRKRLIAKTDTRVQLVTEILSSASRLSLLSLLPTLGLE
jgi:hypothetical protein